VWPIVQKGGQKALLHGGGGEGNTQGGKVPLEQAVKCPSTAIQINLLYSLAKLEEAKTETTSRRGGG